MAKDNAQGRHSEEIISEALSAVCAIATSSGAHDVLEAALMLADCEMYKRLDGPFDPLLRNVIDKPVGDLTEEKYKIVEMLCTLVRHQDTDELTPAVRTYCEMLKLPYRYDKFLNRVYFDFMKPNRMLRLDDVSVIVSAFWEMAVELASQLSDDTIIRTYSREIEKRGDAYGLSKTLALYRAIVMSIEDLRSCCFTDNSELDHISGLAYSPSMKRGSLLNALDELFYAHRGKKPFARIMKYSAKCLKTAGIYKSSFEQDLAVESHEYLDEIEALVEYLIAVLEARRQTALRTMLFYHPN